MAKIRHLVFQTTDPERLAKFYVDVMGLEIVHRAKNGGISLTDGYMNLSIHTNKIDGKPSGFNHFGFLVEDNEALAERFEKLGYRPRSSGRAIVTTPSTGRSIPTATISTSRPMAMTKSVRIAYPWKKKRAELRGLATPQDAPQRRRPYAGSHVPRSTSRSRRRPG